jgi:HEPN domain-containing protein
MIQKNAAYTLEMDDECPTDTVCFHAQQVVEKYLKALLVFKGIPFPKSHNIEDIIALLPPSNRPRLAEKDQDKLTEYATVTRYPGDYEPISLDEAKKAVHIARHVRRQIRKLLPKAVLSRRKK